MDATDGTMSCLFPPSKMPLPMGDLDLHLMVPRAHPSPQPKWHLHLDRFSRFAGHTIMTDRPTDHTIVCNNRSHLRTAMRPNNNKYQLSMTNLCLVLHHYHLHYHHHHHHHQHFHFNGNFPGEPGLAGSPFVFLSPLVLEEYPCG